MKKKKKLNEMKHGISSSAMSSHVVRFQAVCRSFDIVYTNTYIYYCKITMGMRACANSVCVCVCVDVRFEIKHLNLHKECGEKLPIFECDALKRRRIKKKK